LGRLWAADIAVNRRTAAAVRASLDVRCAKFFVMTFSL
jgi:hypothetical protein